MNVASADGGTFDLAGGPHASRVVRRGQVDVGVEADAHFAEIVALGFETTATVLRVALGLAHVQEVGLEDLVPVRGRDRIDVALDGRQADVPVRIRGVVRQVLAGAHEHLADADGPGLPHTAGRNPEKGARNPGISETGRWRKGGLWLPPSGAYW